MGPGATALTRSSVICSSVVSVSSTVMRPGPELNRTWTDEAPGAADRPAKVEENTYFARVDDGEYAGILTRPNPRLTARCDKSVTECATVAVERFTLFLSNKIEQINE
jgi:hypothetical protein